MFHLLFSILTLGVSQVPHAQLCSYTAHFYQISIKRLDNHLQDSVYLPRNNVRQNQYKIFFTKKGELGFPDGSVAKNLLVSAGDTGLIPDPGRSHLP